MKLTPREKDKLLVSLAAMVARGRLERGVKLNHPEAIAVITDFVVEGARDGRSVADLMEAAIHFADEGYLVAPQTARLWQRAAGSYAEREDWKETFLFDGRPPAVGQQRPAEPQRHAGHLAAHFADHVFGAEQSSQAFGRRTLAVEHPG